MELLHENGSTHNDLKLENIMLMGSEPFQIVVIDYGYSTTFLDDNKNHLPQTEVMSFKGNVMFASREQLEFQSMSRKNDMISVCYILIYILHQLKLPFLVETNS